MTGSYTYAEAGSYTVSFTSDPFGTNSTVTAMVFDAFPNGTATPTPLSAPEGADTSFTVGTLNDTSLSADPSEYIVSINWGDGHASDGTITPSGPCTSASCPFNITGNHTYGEERASPFPVSVTITEDDTTVGQPAPFSTTLTPTVTVTDAALSASGATGLSATQNAPSGVLTLAHFTDADPGGTATDYTASVDWGDGLVTNGSIAPGGNGFDVSGQHTYTSTGNLLVTVKITDSGGGVTTATTSIVVGSPPHPVATTTHASSVTPTSAVLKATVDPKGGATARFEYSTDPGLVGAIVTPPQVVPTGLGAVPITATVTGLKSRKTYYYRIDGIDPTGNSVSGAIVSFKTPAPLKRIDSTMNWGFRPQNGYVTVALLIVHHVPHGAGVDVSCSGKGCPRPIAVRAAVAGAAKCKRGHKHCKAKHKRSPAFKDIILTREFRGHRLKFGDKLTVKIVGSGYIGKVYVFKMKSGINPLIGCLAPGSNKPGQGC